MGTRTAKYSSKITNLHSQLADLLDSTLSLAEFCEQSIEIFTSGHKIEQMSLVLYEEAKGVVTAPFSRKMHESLKPQTFGDINSPLKTLLLKNEPLLVTALEYLDYCQDKSIVASIPKVWSGCPIVKDGKIFAALLLSADQEDNVRSIRDLHEQIQSFCSVFSPFLHTRVLLENMRSSEAKYRKLADSSLDITYQVTLKGYISYVSPNIKTIFGVEPSKLIGMHYEKFTPTNQLSAVVRALSDIANEKEVTNLRLTPMKPMGNTNQLEITGAPIYKEGNVIGAQGTVRDISERHQAQQEIERLSFFPMTNPMPVVEIDKEGTPSYINPAGIQLLDRMSLDMSQVALILPPTFKEDIEIAQNNNTSIPSREVSLDGRYLLWSAFFLENQNILHYYGTDITAQKNTELELIEAQQIAVQNEQVKTLFLANMSHEIRTPLNSILGFLELIEEEVKQKYDQDLRSYFDIIRASGKRLWHTVHEILDISQIETGTFPLKIVTVDLALVLKDLKSTFSSIAEEKQIDLQIEIPDEPIWIAADEYCTSQALSNILDNAIKYTNEGHVKVRFSVVDKTTEVTIEDTGIGMSKEYQDEMFNAFSQESTGYTKHFQGVGLGLALAHRYLKLIESDIRLTSEQDVGTSFTISFPADTGLPKFQADPAHSVAEKASEYPEEDQNKPTRVLVVEDDPNSQKLAELILKKDFELYFAESVYDAKCVLESNKIQIILLDLSLKGNEDGLDLARYVRNDSPYKLIPIIALTAHAFTTDREKCFEVGCNEFLTKPFRRTDLIELIYELT
ncbi:MAG: response regulator [Candidatus Marinimicrobia bacterium]|nr:response regulator [Candidatus Neomarinimicrobiota bacterium]MCF7850048.1 response regulator [Candidatus Neomarinimicrobiota bacterium]MCF7904872.1 response regulator [Candidatus Neomarinimicrobiota bacterium]